VPDRARHAVAARFLGETALCDRSPATLARRAGATLLVVGARREGASHRVFVLATLDARVETVDAMTRAATAALEAFVRERPRGWLWLHRRWRAPAPHGRRRALSPRGIGTNPATS
jgi:KDO2-lipid IV(A) lauroyltransferase